MIPRSYLFRDQAALAAGLSTVQPAELTLTSEYEPARDPVRDDGAIRPAHRSASRKRTSRWCGASCGAWACPKRTSTTRRKTCSSPRTGIAIGSSRGKSARSSSAPRCASCASTARVLPRPRSSTKISSPRARRRWTKPSISAGRARSWSGFSRELPLDLRAVFVLFELEDMSTAAIAEGLEIPQGTVASRLRRARKLFHAKVARLRARQTGGGGA